MKARCYIKSNSQYKNYGGRGITVCNEWLGINGFSKFISDMGERGEGMSLDRIDNNGNYEKNNCRWATWHEQGSNKNNNNKVVGVCFLTRSKRWYSVIGIKGRKISLGTYKIYEDAVKARRDAELKYNIIIHSKTDK